MKRIFVLSLSNVLIVLLVLMSSSRSAYSFRNIAKYNRDLTYSSTCRLLSPADDLDFAPEEDEYSSLLNFEKPVVDSTLLEQYSFKPNVNIKPVKERSIEQIRYQKRMSWEHWNDFLEAELGDIEAELTDDSKWLAEARDYIELRRGKAIWSKRSEQEIQAAMKKALAAKGMSIPSAVAQVINAVYVDKTHKMKEYRDEDELACIEFRKWVREQKKKSKRDPIVLAKLELTNVSDTHT
jgi:hypothetical protein